MYCTVVSNNDHSFGSIKNDPERSNRETPVFQQKEGVIYENGASNVGLVPFLIPPHVVVFASPPRFYDHHSTATLFGGKL